MRFKIVRLVVFTTFFLSPFVLSAQSVSVGLKLNPSLGFIRSAPLKQAAARVESNGEGIKEYDIRSRAGFQIGIGGFFQYEINEKFTVLADPSFNYFRAKITQNYVGHSYTSAEGEFQHTIRATAQVKYFYINIPIMVKYELLPYQRVFASGGIGLNINMQPTIYSSEDSVTNQILDGEIFNTSVKKISTQAKADKFSPIGVNLHFGIGKSFLMGRYYNLDIELRYQFPLTSSNLYTTDPNYSSETVLNNVFSQEGKNAMEEQSGKNISRFRSSVISLAIRYVLWSK